MSTIFLFSSNGMMIWGIFKSSEIFVIWTCSFLWIQKDKANFPFFALKLSTNKVNLQTQFIVNLFLLMYIVTFLPSVYNFVMVWTFNYKCFCISLEWRKFNTELPVVYKLAYQDSLPPGIHFALGAERIRQKNWQNSQRFWTISSFHEPNCSNVFQYIYS